MATKKLHTQPTQEELDKKIEDSIKALEQEDEPIIPNEEEIKPSGKEDDQEPEGEEDDGKKIVEEEDGEDEEASEEEEGDKKKVEDKPKEEEKPDYEKKFVDSSTEAQLLYAKNKKITEAIEKAGEVPEPTEEEMIKEFPDWEMMSDFEKTMAKNSVVSKRGFDAIKEATKEFKDMDVWNVKVDEFLTDAMTFVNTPQLEGKEDEFKIFATKQTRRGVDFEDLVSAFLYAKSLEAPKKKKSQMFESGTAGANDKPKPKSDKISTADSIRLRQTDYKKYLRLLSEGKIDNSDL